MPLICLLLLTPALAGVNGHTVRAGETAYSLSRRYHISVDEFARINPGVNVDSLSTGAVVKVRSAVRVKPTVDDATPSRVTSSDENRPEAAKPASVVIEPIPQAQSPAKHKHTGYLSDFDSPTAKQSVNSEPSVAVSFVRVALSLVFVVALAYVSLLALKHFTSGKISVKSPRRNIRVLETSGLGTNRALHVVEVGGRRLLVGSTSSQINLITELEAGEGEEFEEEVAPPADFAGVLQRLVLRQNPVEATNVDRANAAGKLGGILRDGATFLQRKSNAARSLREKADNDEK